VLGIDLAGVVAGVGPGVTRFGVGDEVYGMTGGVGDLQGSLSVLGWGTHSLAPPSFRGATYSGIFTLLPILTGKGRAHHGEILAQAAALAGSGQLTPILDPGIYNLDSVAEAHRAVESCTARGKVVINIARHP
jgi:NADPH2:quinone reductase